jgi:hypothetical protein
VSTITQHGIRCPACGKSTVQRDISEQDGYYVEFCSGGTVQVTHKTPEEKEVTVTEDCEYWSTGWIKKWKQHNKHSNLK